MLHMFAAPRPPSPLLPPLWILGLMDETRPLMPTLHALTHADMRHDGQSANQSRSHAGMTLDYPFAYNALL